MKDLVEAPGISVGRALNKQIESFGFLTWYVLVESSPMITSSSTSYDLIGASQRYSLVVDEDVKIPTKQTNNLTGASWTVNVWHCIKYLLLGLKINSCPYNMPPSI